ncbi:MAG: hypothetical protein ACRDTD_24555, partial [Pseudonocardiaceae bacterium]
MPSESPEPTESPSSPRTGVRLAALIAVLGGLGIGVLAAKALVHGDVGVVAAVLPYLALLLGVGIFTRGNLPVLALTTYLIGPAPADNLLPQVLIFPSSDFAVRPRDMLFLADIVLLGALAVLVWQERGRSTVSAAPGDAWLRWWCAGLLLLALYPVVVGVWFGADQSVAAVLQGATMPLRGAAIAGLVTLWVRRHGWEATLRDIARTMVIAGLVLAVAAVGALLAAKVAAPDQTQFSVLGYPLVVDRRPALPGWGNNILSNYLCVCVAVLMLLRRVVNWKPRIVAPAVVVLLLGLMYTEVRIAMLLSLLIVGGAIVAGVLRRF